VTRILTPKNVEISIPNAAIMSGKVINFSTQAKKAGITLHTGITIGYDVPWPKVQELLLSAATATEHIEEEPKPFVLQTALDDNYVAYELNAVTRRADIECGYAPGRHTAENILGSACQHTGRFPHGRSGDYFTALPRGKGWKRARDGAGDTPGVSGSGLIMQIQNL